jgi:endonuclease/exonuclease/phosphatase family metal-dependent hydrolase
MAVIGCYIAYLPANQYPTLNWLSVFLPIILLLNAAIALCWIWKKSLWMIVPLLSILICFPFISSTLHWNFRKQAPPKTPFTIATYNIRNVMGENIFLDAQQFAALLKQESVDVICLQELPGEGVIREGLIVELTKFLPYYQVSSQLPGTLELAIFSRYPIVEMNPILFTEETQNSSFWVDLDREGDRIRIFNNHLQTTNINQNKVSFSLKIGEMINQLKKMKQVVEENGGIRTRQANVIRKLLDESPYPVIVCGDFNANPASYTYKTIKGTLKDSFREAGTGYGYSYRYLKKLFRIDYILYSPEHFRATRYYSPELLYSDHKPVVVTFDCLP